MSNTDVGGNQQMEQIYMTVNGSRQTDTSVQVDGMSVNSLMNDGQAQVDFSDAAMAEVTYQTSGVTADVSTGGVRINMIPKDGGNIFSGRCCRRHAWQLAGQQRHRRTAVCGPAVAREWPRSATTTSPLAARFCRTSSRSSPAGGRISTDSVIPGSFFQDGSAEMG